jgi:hypothetical protein
MSMCNLKNTRADKPKENAIPNVKYFVFTLWYISYGRSQGLTLK